MPRRRLAVPRRCPIDTGNGLPQWEERQTEPATYRRPALAHWAVGALRRDLLRHAGRRRFPHRRQQNVYV